MQPSGLLTVQARRLSFVPLRDYSCSPQNGETIEMASHAPLQARWLETALAFGFGLAAMATVLWLAFRGSELTEQQFEILRIVLALAGGGVGAVIPGFLDLNLKSGGKLALRAGGALAVFVVLYFWSPARWQPSSDGNVATINAPGGVVSKEINKSPITINNNSTGTTPAK
jgi:hypothetical protein